MSNTVRGTAQAERGAPGDRALAAWEIVSVTASALIAEWVVLALAGRSRLVMLVPVVSAFTLIFLSQRIRRERARDLGWRLDNFFEAVRLLALPMLAATLFCILLGWLYGGLNLRLWRGGWSYLIVPTLGVAWGLMQQFVLQAFINRRAQIIWGRGRLSVFVVALVFGLLHLPNPGLSVATFAGGLLWATVYQRAPNLLALSLSHALMTWVLISTIPPPLLNNLRVGFKYFG
ncbi:MAG TPA: CPBP family glutamic-type intramembrane protease [Pyrinomonadaceae bacterium]|nr:CPBP family glutamic-type intramembrane protease [Pyrinomonadaceae bacterium]